MQGSSELDVAYRYPFSAAAKRIVSEQAAVVSEKYLERGKRHIETAVNEGLSYTDVKLSSAKLDYLMTYLYSRMMLSAFKDYPAVKAYARAEAERAVEAAYESKSEEVLELSRQMNLEISARFDSAKAVSYEEFAIRFDQYLKSAPAQKGYELVNQRLSSGTVIMDRDRLRGFLEGASEREILKGLPIKTADLPKEILDYCKGIKLDLRRAEPQKRKGGSESLWIEKLLKNPIPDVRHRTVNLILAPYLVNVKGLEVEEATKMISEYIDRCKEIDPSTKITRSYIHYQCDYAKKRGMKPLSFDKAKDLLQGALDIEAMS